MIMSNKTNLQDQDLYLLLMTFILQCSSLLKLPGPCCTGFCHTRRWVEQYLGLTANLRAELGSVLFPGWCGKALS